MTKLWQVAVVATTFIFSTLQAENAGFTGCQEGNCFNGYGKYLYANGNRYQGEFSDGKPHGKGILFCANGNKYLGQWEMSWRQGDGKFVFREGHEYMGGFHRNNFHGQGTMAYANGDRYEGNWRANLPNGQGIYFFKKGGRYEGGFQDGSFHGKGNMHYRDGSIFSGNWYRSKKHGEGVFTNAQGISQIGEWVNGKPLNLEINEPEEGEAILVQPDDGEQHVEKKFPQKTFSSSNAASEKSSVRIWATVIGVASYNHMPSLRYTDDDAYHFYAFLKARKGAPYLMNRCRYWWTTTLPKKIF